MASKVDFHELGLLWYGGPLAIIITRKNYLKFRRIERMREFFINEFGIFEYDSESEYRYNKQPLSIYNSHGSIIPKNVVKNVKKCYRKGNYMQIKKELQAIYPEIEDIDFKDIWEMFRFISIMTKHKAIDIDTEKFLPYYRAYNPVSIKRLNEVCQEGKKAIDSLHPSLKAGIPVMIMVVIAIVALAFMQNAPKWIREAGNYFGQLTHPEPAGMIFFLSKLFGG